MQSTGFARRLTESWDRGRGGAGVSDGPERESGIVLEAGCINVSGSPWDSGQENVARVICQVCNADGTPSWTDSRHILQETVKRAEKMGLDFDFDFQCEFYLFHTDDDGRPTTVTHEVAGYYDAGPIDLAEGVRRDMVLSLEEAGFAVESTHHGLTAGQHTSSFRRAGALRQQIIYRRSRRRSNGLRTPWSSCDFYAETAGRSKRLRNAHSFLLI